MMKALNLVFWTLLLVLSSCSHSGPSNKQATPGEAVDSLTTELESSANETAYNLLGPADLDVISSLTVNQKTVYFETDKQLTEYLTFELIDKPLFDRQKSTAVSFLLADTINQKKKNGLTILKCRDKTVKYIDKPDAEEDLQVFTYVGQIEFLNTYVISGSYWESGDFKFVDKTSGEETNSFVDYPHISPDKKNIICINPNGYEVTADLELYSIADNKTKHVMSASFKNWMPALESHNMFWSADGYLYLTVHNAKSFWKENGALNDNYQYMRIKTR